MKGRADRMREKEMGVGEREIERKKGEEKRKKKNRKSAIHVNIIQRICRVSEKDILCRHIAVFSGGRLKQLHGDYKAELLRFMNKLRK